jgi:hypothetical protein
MNGRDSRFDELDELIDAGWGDMPGDWIPEQYWLFTAPDAHHRDCKCGECK